MSRVLPLEESLPVTQLPPPTSRDLMPRYNLGSLAAASQSILCGGTTTGIISLLQSAGATMVLPSVGTMVTGAATGGAGIVLMSSESGTTGGLLADTIAHGHHPGSNGNGEDGDGHPPTDRQAAPQDYLLTPQAAQAIVNSWHVAQYDSPGVTVTIWLDQVHRLCEAYTVPATQRALCAMRHMSAGSQEAARAAECYDMTWDQFTKWLRQYGVLFRELCTWCLHIT